MYQQIYDFGNSPEQQDKQKKVKTDQLNPQQQYNYTLRYPQFHSFDNNNSQDIVNNYPTVFDNGPILPPLNTTPIVVAPLQHHPTTSHQTYLLAQKKPLKGSPRPSRERAPWTPEEDNLLRLAVQLYGDKTEKWAKIAACVPGRTNKNCRKRWFHSLDPTLRKGAWTEEEDQLLREGVSKFPNQWSKIAEMLPGRTDDQCAKRWRESLDPTIDRSEWTPFEDNLLMEKYEEYGSQWQKIAYFFEGRPGLHCRNRWRKLQRMVQVKKEKQEATLNPPFFNTMLVDGQTLQHSTQQHVTFQHLTSLLPPQNNPSALPEPTVMPQFSTNHVSDEFEYGDGIKPYGCDLPNCHAVYPSSSGLFYHMKSNHPNLEGISKPYRCAMANCSKKYKNINGLQYHIKEAKGTTGHGVAILDDDRPYRCEISSCKKAYRTSNGLRYHQQNGHNIIQQQPSIQPSIQQTTQQSQQQQQQQQPQQQQQQQQHFRMKKEKWMFENV